eukprot:7391644-Prymnesium_polylepis.4
MSIRYHVGEHDHTRVGTARRCDYSPEDKVVLATQVHDHALPRVDDGVSVSVEIAGATRGKNESLPPSLKDFIDQSDYVLKIFYP